jgi:hypothetical protein
MTTERKPNVWRYVITHLDKEGGRRLAEAAQGQYTYATAEDAQRRIDAMMTNNSRATLESVFGLPLEVRRCECYWHHDPVEHYFDTEEEGGRP